MIPAYENGYAIVEIDGQFHCMKNESVMLKFNKQPAVYASQVKAEDFMVMNGAKKVLKQIEEEDEDDDLFGSFENEVDKRRQGGKSEYLDSLDAKREARECENAKEKATFVLDEQHEVGEIVWSGNLQYRVSEKPSYLSPKDAAEIEDLDPKVRVGWHTKVELVHE